MRATIAAAALLLIAFVTNLHGSIGWSISVENSVMPVVVWVAVTMIGGVTAWVTNTPQASKVK